MGGGGPGGVEVVDVVGFAAAPAGTVVPLELLGGRGGIVPGIGGGTEIAELADAGPAELVNATR